MGIEFDAQTKAMNMILKVAREAELSNYYLDRYYAFEQIGEICSSLTGHYNKEIFLKFLDETNE